MKYHVRYRSGRECYVSGEFSIKPLGEGEVPIIESDCKQLIGLEMMEVGTLLCLDPRATVKDSFGVVIYQGPEKMPKKWLKRSAPHG